MASISVPPSFPSPFDSQSPPSSPRRPHRRVPSRNPNAAELPQFNFSPGAIENPESKESGDENKTEESSTMDLDTRKSISKPSPLPDFSFNPGADLPVERSPSPTHPVLQEMALNQQRATRSARPAPLPPFTFAAFSNTGQPSPSPTKSSFADMPHSAGSGIGHRRRGSEFVGGGTGGSQLISASPEKPEYRPPPVSGHPRGHTHRRSQAISISEIDTSDLIRANALSKSHAGSTPTTPSETQQVFPIPRRSPPSRASVSYSARSPPTSPRRRDSAPGVRPRVGFADRVDIIPRPLSLISSETDGSCSTIRGGHSLSGSINSIASPGPRSASSISPPIRIEIESPQAQARPKTADPSTLFPSSATKTDKAMSMISLPKRPLSASGSPAVTLSGSPPTKKKHFWFSSTHSSPTPTPRSEQEDPLATTPILSQSIAADATRPRTSPERSTSVKKRKYHTWTSGIFSKKAGKRSVKLKSKRNPTPPALQRRMSDKVNQIFDQDDTVVLREPSPVAQRSHPRPMTAIIPTTSYPFPASQTEATTPVIDLDVAMGFGEDDKAQDTPTRSAASRMAKLHSSERRGNIDAFGSFHKRAESAPMLQPVNRSTFGMHRMGSNASLSEEVFDEEEEDNFLAHETDISPPTSKDGSEQNPTNESPDATPSAPRIQSVDGLGLSMQSVDSDAVIILEAEDDPITAEQRSSKSTIEAPNLVQELEKRPATSPMIFPYSAPQSHYASSTEGRTTSASMISSPDPEHISFDNFPRNNRYLAEPSPDLVLRASNEDLPSLSDSMSSGALPRISSSANTRSSVEQRSASVCVPATSKSNNTAWKRASLASLNRLIPGSANGSKLKFETMPDAAAEEKTKKKSNRISKLMTFWRSKEKSDA